MIKIEGLVARLEATPGLQVRGDVIAGEDLGAVVPAALSRAITYFL